MANVTRTFKFGFPETLIEDDLGEACTPGAVTPTCLVVMSVDENKLGALQQRAATLGWTDLGEGNLVPTIPEFMQTYATTAVTFPAYTPAVRNSAYSGSGLGGALLTDCAAVADLNDLRSAYETLRAHCDAQGQLLNRVIDVLQARGWAT